VVGCRRTDPITILTTRAAATRHLVDEKHKKEALDAALAYPVILRIRITSATGLLSVEPWLSPLNLHLPAFHLISWNLTFRRDLSKKSICFWHHSSIRLHSSSHSRNMASAGKLWRSYLALISDSVGSLDCAPIRTMLGG
jgi:hypothetical protein